MSYKILRASAWMLLVLSFLTGCVHSPSDKSASTAAPEKSDKSVSTAELPNPSALMEPSADTGAQASQVPPKHAYEAHGFVAVGELIQPVLLDVRYYSSYNFVGTRIDGYNAPIVLLSSEAALALKGAAEDLLKQGYMLKIFDGYRPQRAVDHFVRWAKAEDENDQRYKGVFYPDIDKDKLLLGYIAKKSGHSRGSTVDLTIVKIETGTEVDMGTPFDFLCEKSNHGSNQITKQQTINRALLKNAMVTNGFKPYSAEWWHYTLIDEPYPDTYFNFPVE